MSSWVTIMVTSSWMYNLFNSLFPRLIILIYLLWSPLELFLELYVLCFPFRKIYAKTAQTSRKWNGSSFWHRLSPTVLYCNNWRESSGTKSFKLYPFEGMCPMKFEQSFRNTVYHTEISLKVYAGLLYASQQQVSILQHERQMAFLGDGDNALSGLNKNITSWALDTKCAHFLSL